MDYIIIAGPTACGKSQLALDIADRLGGEIINADSMQLYQDLSILTARPHTHPIPHHLYGILSHQDQGSAASWLEHVCSLIKDCLHRNRMPIVVGGTGFYLRALTNGLSPFPPIDPIIRQQVRDLSRVLGDDFFSYVYSVDPLIQDKIKPSDPQRLCRALEVILDTGQSIVNWQGLAVPPLPQYSHKYYVIDLDREDLYDRINRRFQMMIDLGAIEEIENLRCLNPSKDSLIMKAIGVAEISAYLDGDLSLGDAIEKAQQKSRQYAKRQRTWFHHKVTEKIMLQSGDI
ncbi:MAG: tRNA (adenosine(37)-N6)-dimethylallyltransferase MiaA [Alphaproteobacteria bacterium]|nr:tRNA (adenosine(37)-N6)-dimethylallyltransferase MiaA [Alphaproteobacteria bacterium]